MRSAPAKLDSLRGSPALCIKLLELNRVYGVDAGYPMGIESSDFGEGRVLPAFYGSWAELVGRAVEDSLWEAQP